MQIMLNTAQIQSDLDQNTKDFLAMLASFGPEKFSLKPSETAWSPAEVADHVLQVMAFSNLAMRGNSVPTERPFDEKLKVIRDSMASRTASYKSPEMALPRKGPILQSEIIMKLKAQRELMLETVAGSDLSLFCADLKHPGFGGLTRFEWIQFDIHHTQRHMRQLENIAGLAG
jgi:hypothetical protein